MSNEAKGPYTVATDQDGYYTVVIPSGRGRFVSEDMADKVCAEMNLALTSQAARVRELEEALTHIVEYWNRSENDRAMSDALYHMIETAEATLTPKEPQ